jgi:hypothetical protein
VAAVILLPTPSSCDVPAPVYIVIFFPPVTTSGPVILVIVAAASPCKPSLVKTYCYPVVGFVLPVPPENFILAIRI